MSKVRSRTFGYVAMCSELLFIVGSRLFVYSAGSGVNRVQVVLSGFSMRLFCFVQAKTLCMYGCIHVFLGCTRACVCRCDVICVGHDLNRCSGWWYVCSVNVVGEWTPPCGTPPCGTPVLD